MSGSGSCPPAFSLCFSLFLCFALSSLFTNRCLRIKLVCWRQCRGVQGASPPAVIAAVGGRILKISQSMYYNTMVSQVTGNYADIYTWENLYIAYRRAAKGKRSRPAAAAFEYRLEDNLIRLQDELATETYQPGVYTSFTIHEPKRRLISAAPFRDRVVHHALCQVIEPAFERSFIDHSYANRVGKGTHRALDTCQRWARQSVDTTCPALLTSSSS